MLVEFRNVGRHHVSIGAQNPRRVGERKSEFELDAQLSAERARALVLLKGIRV